MQCLRKSEKGVIGHATGVTDNCELPSECWHAARSSQEIVFTLKTEDQSREHV